MAGITWACDDACKNTIPVTIGASKGVVGLLDGLIMSNHKKKSPCFGTNCGSAVEGLGPGL